MRGLKVFGCAGALWRSWSPPPAHRLRRAKPSRASSAPSASFPRKSRRSTTASVPPLVLPPKMELRAPAPPRSAESQANWPKDPDVAAARKAAAEARAPADQHRSLSCQPRALPIRRGDARRPQPEQLHQVALRPDRRPGRQQQDDPGRAALLQHRRRKSKLSGDGMERRYLSDPPAARCSRLRAADSSRPRSMRCRWSIPTARSASFSSSRSAEFTSR